MSLRKQATSGLVWTFAQQFGNQIIGFIVSLILARILLPEEFGLVGMIAIFMAIGKTLMDAGLGQSLVRGEDMDQEDFSTVFFFNVIASCFIYLLIYFAAPFIAKFYEREILTGMIRVLCLTFIFSAFSAVQNARLTKEMNFKIQALISLPATIIGGLVGITMAYMDYGVWSLVWSTVVGVIVSTIQLWIFSGWTPDFIFNINKFKRHFNYGYKLTFSELLNTTFNNIYIVVIGKYFSAGQVGFYTRAQTMKQLPVVNISNALNKVTFPLFAKMQNDNIRLKRVYKQLMQMVVFIITPTLVFLGVLAEPLFRFLFTAKWLPAVPYFQILCITGILYPIHAYNLNILKVKGRSDLFLKLEVMKKLIIVVAIIIAIQYGIIALLWAQVCTSLISLVINTHYTGKFLDYSALEQLKDILPAILLASLAGATVLLFDIFQFFLFSDLFRLLLGGVIGLSVYLSSAMIFKLSSLTDLKNLITSR
ncbi:lipopolysaccharide biosynthesis protein [Salinimicrobium xinjiangense]|uniref:lipopolysaccharide biosynthesis protein n=1 Tax=Salinimicrobium xinjiangense TaxID=438596 RepID=UPI00040FDD36|nr:lipopolysaccharide biosynthesis protein [Salinimicrobium xinjiangense]